MTAFVYVRKSVVREDQPTHSPAVQEERLRALALAHGDEDPVVLADLDVSGKEVERRPGYLRLVEAIESGEAHAAYAYDLSRLHRNAGESDRFWRLVAERGVPVYLTDMAVDPATATGRLIIGMFAQVNAWHSEVTSEKLRATFARKRANGEKLGGRYYGTRPGEDAAAVVEAFRSTGSLAKAARALNDAGLPTRNAASRGWSPAAVRVVVARLAPELLAESRSIGPRGKPAHGRKRHALARLLRCSVCGATMTPSVDTKAGRRYTRYYCHTADLDSRHARRGVQESVVLPAIAAEAERGWRVIEARYRVGTPEDAMTLAELQAKRERLAELYAEGDITRPDYEARRAAVAEEESRLTALKSVLRLTFPPFIVDQVEDGEVVAEAAPAEEVNAYLRRLFDHVEVDLASDVARREVPPLAFAWREAVAG